MNSFFRRARTIGATDAPLVKFISSENGLHPQQAAHEVATMKAQVASACEHRPYSPLQDESSSQTAVGPSVPSTTEATKSTIQPAALLAIVERGNYST